MSVPPSPAPPTVLSPDLAPKATVEGTAALVTAAKPVDQYVPVCSAEESYIPAASEIADTPPEHLARVRTGFRRVYPLAPYTSLEVEVVVEAPCLPESLDLVAAEAAQAALDVGARLVTAATTHPTIAHLTAAS